MKTATYNLTNGEEKVIEYDETLPCIVCGEPVVEASMGGTAVCPWCDCGKCRYCGETYLTGGEKTREECMSVIRKHIKGHKDQPLPT